MKGGWICEACAERNGIAFNGASHPGGYCATGQHHVGGTIRWANDLDVGRNPARVFAAIMGTNVSEPDLERINTLAAICDEPVEVGPDGASPSPDQLSLF